MKNSLCYLLFLITLMGCDSNSQVTQNEADKKKLPQEYELEVFDPQLSLQFQKILEKENIYYKSVSENKIKVKTSDQKVIDKLFFELIESDLPKGRSISLPMPGLEEMVIDEFERNDISYVRKKRHDEYWLVWSKEDSDKANRIIKESEEKIMEQYMDNLNNQSQE